MANQTLARRYATAVFELAKEAGSIERTGSDLDAILSAIHGNEEAARFYLAPIIGRPEKERVLVESFEGRADELALHAVLLLVRKRREPLLRPMVEEYRALQMANRGVEALTITSARPLSSRELASIVSRLEGIYNRRFEAHLVIEPQLIGGMRIMMGDRRVDGTIAGSLDELARTLTTNAT